MLVAYSERALAKALLRLGDSAAARRLAERALEVCHTLDDAFGQACTLRVVGEIHLADGRLYQARDCLADALRRWTDLHSELFQARTKHTLSQVHDALGDTRGAEQLTAEAVETFHTTGAPEQLAIIPTLALTKILGIGLGAMFGGTPLPFAISPLGAGIWLVVVILGVAIATDAAITRASRITVREALTYL